MKQLAYRQVKIRNIYLCNLKSMLILLVLIGHMIEPYLSNPFLKGLYQIIYSFHMPMFVMLSGISIRSYHGAIKQFKNSLWIYFLSELIYALYANSCSHTTVNILIPFWHLWYIWALAIWSLFGMFFLWLKARKIPVPIILIFSVILSLIAGFLPWGRFLSLQRILAFLPYYATGMFLPNLAWFMGKISTSHTQNSPNTRKFFPLSILLAGFLVTGFFYVIVCYVPVSFLYQAEPYSNGLCDMLMRAFCEIGAIISIFLFMSLIQNRKYLFTFLGGDTLLYYLLHPIFLPLAPLFQSLGIPMPIALILTLAITLSLLTLLTKYTRPAIYYSSHCQDVQNTPTNTTFAGVTQAYSYSIKE